MTSTPRALFAFVAFMLLAFAACSPTSNNNTAPANANAARSAGNANTARPAANANSDGAANTNAPKSKPGTGTLEVASVPAGAGITLVPPAGDRAGAPLSYGATPAMINDLAPGKYTVSLSKPGYKNFQQEVEVKAGATARVKAALKK